MDINILRGIATIIVMSTFLGICWWAYIYRSKESFNEAAQSPFADEALDGVSGEVSSASRDSNRKTDRRGEQQ